MTRLRILATALDLFLVEGYDATSLREIAETVGITKAALYYHFPAKEQMVVELTRPFLNELAELLARARSASREDWETSSRQLLSEYFDHLVAHRKVVELLGKNPSTQNHPDVGQRARNLIQSFTAELAGPDASSSDKLRAACAVGAIHAVATSSPADAKNARVVILGAAVAALDSDPLEDDRVEHSMPLRSVE